MPPGTRTRCLTGLASDADVNRVRQSGGACTINGVSYTVCSTNGNLNQRRKLGLENPTEGRLIGALDLHDDVGWQSYHGLRMTIARRAATGLSISGNYTVSTCKGTATPGSFPLAV